MIRNHINTTARALQGSGAFVCARAVMAMGLNRSGGNGAGARSPGKGDMASP
jgi:hypothetical protein